MGVAIPRVVTEVSASGAQVIDGSLRMDSGNNQYMKRTPSITGNTRTFTWSGWVKRNKLADTRYLYSAISGNVVFIIGFETDYFYVNTAAGVIYTQAKIRDIGWYHFTVAVDTTQATDTDRVKLYINGVRQTEFVAGPAWPLQNNTTAANTAAVEQRIGRYSSVYFSDFQLSQVNFIDGQALGPENFGYTDPLTNTWRPKKLEGVDLNGTTFTSQPIIYWTHTGGAVSSGVYNAAIGNVSTGGSYSGDTWTATNSAWVDTWDMGSADSFTLSSWSVGSYSDQTWYWSNDSSFASGVTGPNSGTIANGTYSTTVSGTKYRYLRVQNIPSATYSVVGNNSHTGKLGTNGFYLPFDGNTPIGKDLSQLNPINDGTVWSSYIDGSDYNSGHVKANMFNGSSTTGQYLAGSSSSVTITFPGSGLDFSSSLRIMAQVTGGSSNIVFNWSGGSHTEVITAVGAVWWDVSSDVTSPVTSITWTSQGGTAGPYINALEVDGVILHDDMYGNSWTPVNFGGSTVIPKATGALPILNTVNGGKVATVGVRTDASGNSCVLALPLVGSKDDVSNQINSGSTTKAVTTNGDPTASTTQSNFYGGSFDFDGTGDYFNTSTSSSDFSFGTGDFTIEAWCFVDSGANNKGLWQLSTTSGGLQSATTTLSSNYEDDEFYFGSAGGWRQAGRTHIDNTWHHVAEVRNSGTISIYVDGVLDQSWSDTSTYDMTYWAVGGYYSTSYLWSGYIQDFRVYKGVAKYTENFIPASTNPDILPETPSGVAYGSQLTKVTDGAVAFDGTGDYLSIPWSNDFDLGSSDFTIEMFVNFQDDATTSTILSWGADSNNRFDIGCQTANTLRMYGLSSGTVIISGSWEIVPDKWTHVAVVGYSDVGGSSAVCLYVDGIKRYANLGALDTYAMPTDASNGIDIGRRRYGTTTSDDFKGFISNVRIVKGSALYTYPLNFTPPSAPLTDVTNTKLLCCQSTTSATAAAVFLGKVWSAASHTNFLESTFWQAFDDSATTYAETTATNDIGSITFDPPILISSITTFKVNSSQNGNLSQNWGFNGGTLTARVCNGITDIADLLPGSGNLTSLEVQITGNGVAIIQEIEINGDRLVDATITANGNAAATNFNPFTDDINTVMGQETGYATANPLGTSSNITLSNGNLSASMRSSAGHGWTMSNLSMSPNTGKYYMECKLTELRSGGQNIASIGLCHSGGPVDGWVGTAPSLVNYFNMIYNNGSTRQIFDANVVVSNYLTPAGAYTVGDVFQMAYDSDNKVGWFGINGLWYKADGTTGAIPSTGSNPTWVNFLYDDYFFTTDGHDAAYDYNYGQKPFKYAPPEGFQPLNYANLPSPGVVRSDSVVGVTTYAGDGTSRGPTDLNPSLNFYPDFIWLKGYTDPDKHGLYDTVRGPEKRLQTGNQGTNAQDTVNGVMEFLPNGFRIGDYAETNGDGRGYVAWCWKAGGNKNTFNVDDVGYATAAAAGLTGGDITPVAASVGTKQGFSIIQYQGNGSTDQTIPHGLTQAPDFSLIKNIDGVANWTVFHTKATTTTQKVFYLNTNGVVADYSGGDSTWWGTLPGATVFTIGATSTAINNGSNDMISYHWHDVPGLQKFGQWKNNNSNDGTFVELGFRPAIILLKCTDATEAWYIINDERYPNNLGPGSSTLVALQPNSDNSESSTVSNCVNAGVDILSNGFKIRSTNTSDGEISYGTRNYIYAAWAHQPMNNLFGAQSNAR